MSLKEDVMEKADEDIVKVLKHVYDAGYADGMQSRQQEIDDLTEDRNEIRKKLDILKEALEKL